MATSKCFYCKEEVKADARVCKHCNSRLRYSRKDRLSDLIQKIGYVYLGEPQSVTMPVMTPCAAGCYSHHLEGAALDECLQDCKAIEASKLVWERLHMDLYRSFIEVVWEGGDIDPKPLEDKIRERFSQPGGGKEP